MVRCRVKFEGYEAEVSVESEDASIEMLVTKARDEAERAGRAMPPLTELVARRERDNKQVYLKDPVKGLDDGEVLVIETHSKGLESRSRILTIPDPTKPRRELTSVRARSTIFKAANPEFRMSKKQDCITACEQEIIPPGLPDCRQGVFVVTPLKAEKPPFTSRWRLPRLSISIRLLPYEDIYTTPTAAGPAPWWSTPFKISHFDPTRSGLILQIGMYGEPYVGSRYLIGRAYVELEDAFDAPGTPLRRWVRVDPAGDGISANTDATNSRILVALCFHPKVSKGPTVHSLLHSIAQADTDATSSEIRAKSAKFGLRSRLRMLLSKSWQKSEIRAIDTATLRSTQSLRRIKGSFTFELRGIHLCGDYCTNLDGHSTVSLPDFSPIILVRFEDFEDELCVSASDCNTVIYANEWPVYSSYSKVEVEIYRRASLRAGSVGRRLMSDGSSAVKVGNVAISCFDVQEQVAVKWTLIPLDPIYGPGKRLPDDDCQWYPVILDDEDIGLAHVSAHYSEDMLPLVDGDESPDLAFIPPEERSFDAVIVQRNFERLDDLYLAIQEVKNYYDELLDLKYPLRSFLVWAAINGFFFALSAEHLPLLLLVFVLSTLSITFRSFLRGGTHTKWIEHNPSASRMKMFRPIGTLRFAAIRASHLLPMGGDDHHPDSFVRIFYEPNFKKIPVQQIAVTECAKRTQNPEWSSPQRESIRDDFLRRNNNRLRELIRHLSAHVQDAVVHDVVEPWPRKNGVVDLNAFRLSILQPVRLDETGDEVLVEWRNAPGTIRFDVLQDTQSDMTPLLGRVRIPIRSLITDETCGGTQREFELTLPLALPPRHTTHSRPGDQQNNSPQKSNASITVRMQMILRNPGDRVTLRDTLASEALYEALEMEIERELSWVAKYHKAKDVAKNFQQTLEIVCSTLERFKNLFLWVHPVKTLVACVLALLGCVCFYFIPMRFFVLYNSTKAFTRTIHKAEDRDLIRFRNLLASIPSDLDMKRIYRWRNQEYLKAKEFSEAHARLQAQWSGFVLRQRYSWVLTWQERYCAIREGRLEFWNSITDAKAGLPPRQSFHISNSVDCCTKAELVDVPRDCYALVVFDVSPSLLASSPRGRRRILCLKSEDAFHKFSDAVRISGEPIDVDQPQPLSPRHSNT